MKGLIISSCLLVIVSCSQNKNKNTGSFADTTQVTDSSTSINKKDQAHLDLTGRYHLSFQPFTDSTYFDPASFRIAVIPVAALGAVDIDWSEMKKGNSVETEKEFETALLNCVDGKDKTSETPAAVAKKDLYCEREGYTDHGGMESYPWLYYGAFVKDNRLVIAELFTSFSKCKADTKKEREECEAENENLRKAIRHFMDNLVKTIAITSK